MLVVSANSWPSLIGHVAGGRQNVSLADGVLLFIGGSGEGCS
jgi:hypothetical protein